MPPGLLTPVTGWLARIRLLKGRLGTPPAVISVGSDGEKAKSVPVVGI